MSNLALAAALAFVPAVQEPYRLPPKEIVDLVDAPVPPLVRFSPDGAATPTLALNLCRLSRGKMLGVDFNKDFTWVGSSVALRAAG